MSDLFPAPQRILYDRKGAAFQLTVSVRALDYLIAQGKIPTRRINSSVRIRHEDLKEFARKNHSYDPLEKTAEEGS